MYIKDIGAIMNEFQIQLKTGKQTHFKTAVRAFDKNAIIISINNSDINFNLKTSMELIDVSKLTSVKISTQINKEEVKTNISPISEETLKVNMDPLGYVQSFTPTPYFSKPSSSGASGKLLFTVVEDIRKPREIKDSLSLIRREAMNYGVIDDIPSLSRKISEYSHVTNNYVIACKDRIDSVASAMEAEISECSDKDKKLELLQEYVNFLKYTKLLL